MGPSTADAKALDLFLQSRATNRTRDLLARALSQRGLSAPRVEIRFDLKGQSAGQARFGPSGPWIIRYNPVLLRENGDSFIAATVPHEVAHLIAFLCHGPRIRPHGPEWRAIMEQFGAPPERCHQYDLSRIPQPTRRVFIYHCGCSEHRLTAIRHRRVLAGQTYLCRQCAGPLRPGRRAQGSPDRSP